MAKRRRVLLADAIYSANREQKQEFIDAMKKRQAILWLLTLIPGVNWVTGSMLVFNRNTIREIKGKQPGGLLNIIIVLWCLLIPPMVMNWIIKILGENFQNGVVLGVDKVLDTWHYKDED